MTKEELEKEAEEYVCKRNPLVTKEWFIDAFKKYNKGEKVKYLKDCEIAEYEAYIAGAEFGYNKANEWHYVKDGDLPKEEKEYLVYKIDGYGCKSIQVMQFNNQHCWCANCQNEIIAWKEIVLPKEIE